MTHKLTIGQTLYSYSSQEYVVSKIGKKYFECENQRNKFYIETLKKVTEYSDKVQLYVSKQEVLDIQELELLEVKLRDVAKRYGKTGLTLEQLREINKIISQ